MRTEGEAASSEISHSVEGAAAEGRDSKNREVVLGDHEGVGKLRIA